MSTNRTAIYQLWLSQLKADLINEYNKSGLKASGAYERELEAVVTNDKVTMWGAYHSQFMQIGRRPTKAAGTKGEGVLTKAILEWIDAKSITPEPGMTKKTLAFLIARKIHRDGIIVPNKYNSGDVISKVITDERILELVKSIEYVEVETISSDIMKLLKSA